MEIKGKVHCFFEQSGTFKNEFIKLGIPAEDYDIQNNYGETDHSDDLFQSIEDAYEGKPSLWDNIATDDLIIAFFPCIYFCAPSPINFTWGSVNYRKMTVKEKTDAILERDRNRSRFYGLAIKMFALAATRDLRLIMENPWSENTYLKANFILPPSIVDTNRMLRGDYRVKPTAYWFLNCEPTRGATIQLDKLSEKKTHKKSRGGKSRIVQRGAEHDKPGLCQKLHLRLYTGKGTTKLTTNTILGQDHETTPHRHAV